jgi:hypothetical protein
MWQPIATAPKDGTPIILAVAGGDYYPRSAWWSAWANNWVVRENDAQTEATYLTTAPTHWMPLPEPPAEDA